MLNFNNYEYDCDYNTVSRILTVTIDDNESIDVFSTGCIGQDGSLDKLQEATTQRNLFLEKDARGQVFKALADATATSVRQNKFTLLFLVGDLIYPEGVDVNNTTEAIQAIKEQVLNVCQAIDKKVLVSIAFGNHEAACEGKGPGSEAHALQKEQAFIGALEAAVAELKAEGVELPQFFMPNNFYAILIKNKSNEVLANFVVADTNLLPINSGNQLTWLQNLPQQFKEAGATEQTTQVFVGHHTTSGQTVSPRMFKYEAKKYANSKVIKANQHALILAALQKINFPIDKFIVLASHIHDTTVQVRGIYNSLQPLLEIAVSGGSWSNKRKFKTSALGLEYADPGFSYAHISISALPKTSYMLANDERYNVSVSIYDCSAIKLQSNEPQSPEHTFHVKVDYEQQRCEIDLNARGIHKKLLTSLRKGVAFIEQAKQSTSGVVFLQLACHLWKNFHKELQALESKKQNNPITVLLRSCLLPNLELEEGDQQLLSSLEASIYFLILPINSVNDIDEHVGLKHYAEIYKTLQIFHYALASENKKILENALGSPSISMPNSNLSAIEEFSDLVEDDDKDFEEEDGWKDYDKEQQRAMIQAQREEQTEEEPAEPRLQRLYAETFLSVHADKADLLKKFFEQFLATPDELRQVINVACRERLKFLYNHHYENAYGKHLDKNQLNFIAHEQPHLARLLTVDFLSKKISPLELIIAIQQFQVKNKIDIRADLSGFILSYLATQFVLYLKKQSTSEAVSVLQAWSEAGNEHHMAFDFLTRYFTDRLKNEKSSTFSTFLSTNSVTAIWKSESIFEKKLQEFYKVEQNRDNFAIWQKQPSFYWYNPQSWLRVASSSISNRMQKSDATEVEEGNDLLTESVWNNSMTLAGGNNQAGQSNASVENPIHIASPG